MANESEKLTINLGVVELAQIDVLVEQGLYSNRSDFIRSAVRKHLETYSEKIEQRFSPVSDNKKYKFCIGIMDISRKMLENIAMENGKLDVSVIGMLVIDDKISADLFEKTVRQVTVKGKLVAPDYIKEIIAKMN